MCHGVFYEHNGDPPMRSFACQWPYACEMFALLGTVNFKVYKVRRFYMPVSTFYPEALCVQNLSQHI